MAFADIQPNTRAQLLGRSLIAIALSLFLHSLPAITGVLARLAVRALPKPRIEFELLPPKPKPKAPPPEPVALPPPAAQAPPPVAKDPKDAARPAKKPVAKDEKKADKMADKRLDVPRGRLTGLGPAAVDDDFGLRVLLRPPALRSSPHRAVVEALLAAFPDTHILAAGTPLAPPPAVTLSRAFIDDLDALLITTSDPRDITATTFYAQLRPDTQLLSKLDRRRILRWDPRRIHALRPDLFAFARADLLGPATTPIPATPRSLYAPPADTVAKIPEPPPPALDPAWVDKLAAALRQPGPAVYAELHNPHGRIRLRGELPTPTGVRLVLTAEADPQVVAQVELANSDDAARLLAALPGLKSEISGRLFWVGLGSLLSDLRFALAPGKSGHTVEIKGRIPRGDTAVLLMWMKGFLPPPDRFPDLVPPPPPPPAAGDPPDGGTTPSDAGPR